MEAKARVFGVLLFAAFLLGGASRMAMVAPLALPGSQFIQAIPGLVPGSIFGYRYVYTSVTGQEITSSQTLFQQPYMQGSTYIQSVPGATPGSISGYNLMGISSLGTLVALGTGSTPQDAINDALAQEYPTAPNATPNQPTHVGAG